MVFLADSSGDRPVFSLLSKILSIFRFARAEFYVGAHEFEHTHMRSSDQGRGASPPHTHIRSGGRGQG